MRPAVDWHKGKALLHIMELLIHHYVGIYPIFIGDNVTDEDTFSVVKNCGLGILVSQEQRRTKGAMILKDKNEVKKNLQSLISFY
ncbi:trehalose-phosphatase [Candidatus Coxiella mudrowiae]|uniref:trehalose-phosphatase n=1 Tax=Candidatus Coxiella mudrowiae TaxID=2054173 RepID=UPI0012FF4F48|nr:trehalose-phosphatase [Candidatus Coxiella mudrowiae]